MEAAGLLSEYSWTTVGSEFEFRLNEEFSFLHVDPTGFGAHAATSPIGTGGNFPRVKRLGREATMHLPPVPMLRIHGAIYPLTHKPSWRNA
jgi:hypothetical protein